ncbi:Uncharacterised protein [Vibrio cholerae]|nr:Uncharacterised protein [Vibrio cholerae]
MNLLIFSAKSSCFSLSAEMVCSLCWIFSWALWQSACK